VQLAVAALGDHLRERDVGALGREGDRIRPALLVLGQAGVVLDAVLVERLRDLAHTVGAEVERQHGVTVADRGVLVADLRRVDELVRLAALVGGLARLLAGAGLVLRLPPPQQLDRLLGAVPARVAVHREVAPDHRADAPDAGCLAPLRHRREHLRPRLRRRVAPVGERMDHQVLDALLRGQLDQRLQVPVRRVHAAFGHQPDQMHARRGVQRIQDHLVLGQRAVLDRLVDPHEVLLDDRPSAEVEVAYLGVAHLPGRQPDRLAAGGQRRVVVLRPQLVEHRRVGERDRVPRSVRRQPPTVEDDEADAGDGLHEAATSARAISTICANEPGSSEAPPTSAPSTSGSASSSSAFSGLSDPP
jgi:hypothetical protein